jgi:hypothetical protein
MFKEAFTPVTTLGKIYVRAEKFVRLWRKGVLNVELILPHLLSFFKDHESLFSD